MVNYQDNHFENNNIVYTVEQIKEIVQPILHKYNIYEVYLFGSYARGEAKPTSDIDIYCEKGDIKTLVDCSRLINELSEALNKEVDVIFNTASIEPHFKDNIMKDLIKLC